LEVVVILLVIIAVVALAGVLIYNGLVARRNRVDEAVGQIEVQLKRRHDLVPNLVSAVKGYMDFEQDVLTRVTDARANAVAAGASGQITAQQAQAVLSLQEQLTTTENQISFSRQHYNATVNEYNTTVQTVPAVLIAGPMGFTKREFFAAEPEAQDVPVVSLR
jgi:LemA protein